MTTGCLVNDDCQRSPFDELLPEVMMAAQGIGSDMAIHYLRDSTITFCKRSKVLVQDLMVKLQSCVDNPIIEPLCDDLQIVSLHKVCGREVIASTPCPCDAWGCKVRFLPPNQLQLFPAPPASALDREMMVTVSVTLKRDACDIPTVLLDRYGETIVAGALLKLYEIPNTPFHNLRLSELKRREFENGITAAGLDRLLGYAMGPIPIRRMHHRIV